MAIAIEGTGTRRSILARVSTWPLIGFMLLPVLAWALGGGNGYWISAVAWMAVLPVLDNLIGPDRVNAAVAFEPQLEQRLRYRLMLWLCVPVQWGVALFGLYVLSHEPLTSSAMTGLILSLSVSVGIGVVVAHELCHHAQKFDRFMGVLLFTPTNMADFHLYHNIGHHNLVATPDDPASARYNEPVYPFVLRCIVDKSRLAWRIGRDSMAVRGLPVWHWRNQALWLFAAPLLWLAATLALFGWVALPVFVGCWLFPRLFLAFVDYLEHYGLGRRRLTDGSYEPVRAEHAWDDSYLVSSMISCQITRHSDHHAKTSRPYQILRVRDEAPRLPYGYMTMIWVVMVPPLWRRLMNPIVEAFYASANIAPHGRPQDLPERFRARAVY